MNSKILSWKKIILVVLLSTLGFYSFKVKNNLYIGHHPESMLKNLLERFFDSVDPFSATDILLAVFVFCIFFFGFSKKIKPSVSSMILSGLLAASYVMMSFYAHFDSLEYMFFDKFQFFVCIIETVGLFFVFLFITNLLERLFISVNIPRKDDERFSKRFFFISSLLMFAVWMVWILGGYPGGTNPDAVLQLKNFYGDVERTAWQPPFSTLIMGGLFELGRIIKDADFGFFLYNVFQALCGALVFSYSLYLPAKAGTPKIIPILGTVFFSFLPMWGAYAQWFEKDFLYTVSVVWFVSLVLRLFLEKRLSVKATVILSVSGLMMSLLRGNGIYVFVPTLLATAMFFKKDVRKKLLISFAGVLISFELVTRVLYPCLGIGKTSVSETIGFMFQATARYVNEYPDEVTDFEKEVLSQNFQSYDNLFFYDAKINDPVKIYYNHSNFKAYLKIWFEMFKKHPIVYAESYLNGSYGYLAPVSFSIGPWIVLEDYDSYLIDLGISHIGNVKSEMFLANTLNRIVSVPIVKYMVSPGLYTWITVILAWILIKNKRRGTWIILIPSAVNILVCTASPLSDAMRYALPTVALTPLMVGWAFLVLSSEKINE